MRPAMSAERRLHRTAALVQRRPAAPCQQQATAEAWCSDCYYVQPALGMMAAAWEAPSAAERRRCPPPRYLRARALGFSRRSRKM